MKSFKDKPLFCMEATGIYGLALAKYLFQQGYNVIVANPLKTNHFAKMEMSRNKTDKADSMSIARYCKHLENNGQIKKSLFTPKSESYEALQYLNTRLEQLDKLRTQENNRLSVSLNKIAKQSVKSVLKSLEKQVITIKKEMSTIVKQDDNLQEQVNLLTSINGIGEKTAWSILAYIGDISLFSNANQISSFVGLNPQVMESGTSINKTGLSKKGNKYLRKSLYMPSVVAIRYNPLLKDLYERLY
jgi:transposase